jgi:hypothetical protein
VHPVASSRAGPAALVLAPALQSELREFMFKNMLIALGVFLGLALLFEAADRLTGVNSSGSLDVLPLTISILTFFVLQMKSGNRREARADDAARRAALDAPMPHGQALLYVYREGFAGKAVAWDVALDGAVLAQLKSPRFTQAVVRPGPHKLNASIGGMAGKLNQPGEIEFTAQPGEIIVFAAKANIGALKSTLGFVREADPQAALQKLSTMPMVAVEGSTQAAPA